jgi:pseudaminic acid cytidylyltransferase
MLLIQLFLFIMSNICIIPARGGSKRIPRKNIKTFCGKPIIAYSIEAAINSKLFDEVMVSTDDEEIATIAIQYGAKVPFLRSEENSNDYAGTIDVILEVLQNYNNMDKIFTYACCIYPTAPLIQINTLTNAYNILLKQNFETVFPITSFSFPILRALQVDERSRVSMIWPENMSKRSQDLAPAYHDAGQFYWMKVSDIQKNKKLYTDYSGVVILNDLDVQDIDNETDWVIAEMKYKFISKGK